MNKYNLIKTVDENYSIIEVIDCNQDIVRILKSPNSNQSASYIDERRFQLYDTYSKLYDICSTFKENTLNVLMLGGGGFSYPKYYISKYPRKKIDVVEINKDIIDIANEYFFLEELYIKYDKRRERLKIYNVDAMDYITNCKIKYDSIIIDLFSDLLPLREFFFKPILKKINRLLKQESCLCINYIITDANIGDFTILHNNLKEIYYNVYLISTHIAFQNCRGNVFIVCSNQKVKFENYNDYNILNIEMIN